MALDHAQLCRLSRLFNEHADLRVSEDYELNEFLKEAIAAWNRRPVAPAADQVGEVERLRVALDAAVTAVGLGAGMDWNGRTPQGVAAGIYQTVRDALAGDREGVRQITSLEARAELWRRENCKSALETVWAVHRASLSELYRAALAPGDTP